MELLRRAGGQLLTITCSTRRAWSSERLEYILNHCVGQVATAVLPATTALITPSFAREATYLETLTFFGPSMLLDPSAAESEQPVPPYDFPALRHLRTVSTFPGPITHLCPSTLTSLVLRASQKYFNPTDAAYPSHILARALLHTPFLEVLVVDLHEYTDTVTVAPALPYLRQLSIRGLANPCVALYRALQVPRSTRLELECTELGGVAMEEVSQAIVAALADQSIIDGSRFEPVVAFAVQGSGSLCGVHGWRSPALAASELDDRPADVVVRISTRCLRRDVLALMTAIPLPQPRVLRLQTVSVLNGRPDASALASLPSLKTVVLRDVAPYVACDVVAATPADELHLCDIEFRDARLPTPTPGRPGADSCALSSSSRPPSAVTDPAGGGTVRDFAAACARRAPRLARLCLAKVRGVSEADAALLRGVVGALVWDEHGCRRT